VHILNHVFSNILLIVRIVIISNIFITLFFIIALSVKLNVCNGL
jgi:hypothetical protein